MIPFSDRGGTARLWLRLAVFVLVVAALGLPVNGMFRFLLLGIAAIVIFSGTVTLRPMAWLGAVSLAAFATLAPLLWPSPRIEEGHNLFLAGEPGRALQAGLPTEVYRHMAERFDAQYPMAGRCHPAPDCWRGAQGPGRTYAFSADGLLDTPEHSRRVEGIDFSEGTWLRLGFVNERAYNWYSGIGNLQRVTRNRGIKGLFDPWRVEMPYFVMISLPAAYVGGELCWRGEVLWETYGERFDLQPHGAADKCRLIMEDDIGRRIFGVSIMKNAPLAMSLSPPWNVRLWQAFDAVLALAAALAIVLLLVRWERPALKLPFVLSALALVVVALNDSSILGGVRPFDGGDDGLFYDGVGREIAQHLARGEWALALRGGEDVFYYGGPGLRYVRALERFVFGEGHLGYLALLMALPLLVFVLFRRFLGTRAALAMALIFVAVPVGGLFGTSFYQYAKWATRGFADPAAYIFFIGGLVMLVGRSSAGPDARFAPAFAAALLFALALFMRPIVAPAVAVLLAGAALAALSQRRFVRVAGLCLGFLPAFGMTLHNWVFGHELVLFSANAGHPQVYVTPLSVYLAALRDLVIFDWGAGNIGRVLTQVMDWLSGPSESWWAVPLHAAAMVVLIRVVVLWGGADFWIRLFAGAALTQHLVGLTHVPVARYYYAAWFLTLLVVAVWLRDEGLPWLRQRYPGASAAADRSAAMAAFRTALDRWMRWTGLAGAAR